MVVQLEAQKGFKMTVKKMIKGASDEKDERLLTWGDLVNNLTENTVPRMSKANSVGKKVFWIIVLLFGLGMLTYQVTDRFIKYFNYPTVTEVEVPLATELPYPTITFCNLNPMRRSKLTEAGIGITSLCGSGQSYQNSDWSSVNESDDKHYLNWSLMELKNKYYDEKTASAYKADKFQMLYSTISLEKRRELGHQLDRMLIGCEFNGRPCSPKNFTALLNPIYGNCYSFNADGKLKSSQSGPRFGLKARVFLEQNEYVDNLSDNVGIKVVVHNHTDMPFPDEEGYGIAPGHKSGIALYRNDRHLYHAPYGDCEIVSEEKNRLINGYNNLMNTSSYSKLACTKTCLQKHIIAACNCSNYKYPSTGPAFENFGNFSMCDVESNATDAICLKAVERKFFDGLLNCTKSSVCPPKCQNSEYKATIWETQWPSAGNEMKIAWDVAIWDKKIMREIKMLSRSGKTEYLRKNVLEFEVYFQTMKIHIISTKPAYSIPDLLSDLGGQIGLWMGLSIITVFEIGEVALDALKVILKRRKSVGVAKTTETKIKKLAFIGSENKGKEMMNSKSELHPSDDQKLLWGDVVVNLTENTIPRMSKAKSIKRKLFWLVILFFGLAMLCWQVTDRFTKYYNYPTMTNIKVPLARKLPFPTITFCNENPIRKSMLHEAGEEIQRLVENGLNYQNINWEKINESDSSVIMLWSGMEAMPNYFQNSNKLTEKRDKFQKLFSKLSLEKRIKLGHRLEKLLIGCEYNGRQCSPKNFTVSSNPKYGNCFTFNPDGKLEATQSGSRFGLKTRIFLQQEEYIDSLSNNVGLKVVVHDYNDVPFPEEEGFGIAPGKVNEVGLFRRERILSKPPYGDCRDMSAEDEKLSAYKLVSGSFSYNKLACTKTCLQKEIISKCKCANYKYPTSGKAFNNMGKFHSCDVNPSSTEGSCLRNVERDYLDGKLNCTRSDVCPPKCHNIYYKTTLSGTQWPSIGHEETVAWNVALWDQAALVKFKRMNNLEKNQYMSKNAMEFEIFLQSMKYQVIETTPAYTPIDLLSDLGGQIGLWMGLSIITVFEIGEVIMDTIQVLLRKRKAVQEKGNE
ncbi:DgyrCDS10151 [Dimorphilus gyrociliatus]|uniref:DgyrCDS10151 n=1 Tax=Dimorphilus gyrociliatus TaxID=2664684 RepID=A0A7I8W1X9_9ANNE|nr:DgyrCDS10151 [Dimorphilus gyrociliatus]